MDEGPLLDKWLWVTREKFGLIDLLVKFLGDNVNFIAVRLMDEQIKVVFEQEF